MVSDTDIFKKIHATKGDYHGINVSDVMTTEILVGLLTDELTYIAGLMDKNWIRHVPIVEGEEVIGVISQRDVIRMQTEHMHIENRYLNLYMEQMHRRDKSGDPYSLYRGTNQGACRVGSAGAFVCGMIPVLSRVRISGFIEMMRAVYSGS